MGHKKLLQAIRPATISYTHPRNALKYQNCFVVIINLAEHDLFGIGADLLFDKFCCLAF
jgi:hypothetical protein